MPLLVIFQVIVVDLAKNYVMTCCNNTLFLGYSISRHVPFGKIEVRIPGKMIFRPSGLNGIYKQLYVSIDNLICLRLIKEVGTEDQSVYSVTNLKFIFNTALSK